MRESESINEIERTRAKARQQATQLQGKDKNGDPVFGGANIGTTDKGKSREKVSKKIGMSHGTYDKAKKIWARAKDGEVSSP